MDKHHHTGKCLRRIAGGDVGLLLDTNQNLTNEKVKIDRKFKKLTYPSGWHHGWSQNAKRDRQVHTTEWFLYSVC